MTIPVTKEMHSLFDIFYPWINLEDRSFKEGTPQEAIEAWEKFDVLFDELYQLELELQLRG